MPQNNLKFTNLLTNTGWDDIYIQLLILIRHLITLKIK